jgi:hypothetical protein
MSVVMTIEVEGNDPSVLEAMPAGYEAHELAQIIDDLDDIARQEGLPELSRFIQLDPNDLEEIANALEEDGLEVPDYQRPDPMAWHDPEDALTTIRGIMSHLTAHLEWIEKKWANMKRVDDNEILPELEAFEQCLAYLASRQLRFRFDYS